jgi:hypothetical protein
MRCCMVRLFLVIIAMLVGASIQTSAQDAATQRFELKAQQAKKQYWDCLADETAKVVSRKMSGQDFVIYIKSACLNEQYQFRDALINVFSRNRKMDQHMLYATVDRVIAASMDNFASIYVDLKSDPRQ